MRVQDEWLLTPQRLAVHEATATAVIADLHLGYSEARRQGGDSIPLVDLGSILAPLDRVFTRAGVKRLVIAGDLFEKRFVSSLYGELLAWLALRGVALAGIVPGNHDRDWDETAGAPLFPDGFPLGDWLITHGHVPSTAKRVVLGHWHPAMSYRGKLSPCFLVSDNQLVLPAYSQDAAGVNVWGVSGWQGCRCLMIASSRVVDVGVIPSPRTVVSSTSPSAPVRKKSRPWQGRLRPG